jgi:hypothetical protein
MEPEKQRKKRKFSIRTFLFKFKAHPWEDSAVQTEANRRSKEISALKYQARLLEHEKEVAKQQYKLSRLKDEISFYEEDKAADQPGQDFNQMLPFLMMLMSGQKPEPQDFLKMLNPGFVSPSKASEISSTPGFAAHASTPVNAEQISLSDEEISETLKTIPKNYLKMAKKFPDQIIKSYAEKHFNFNEPTVERAIEILRTEK